MKFTKMQGAGNEDVYKRQVLNKVLQMGQAKMQVKIVSGHYEEINHAIATQLDRGVTLLKSVTGYLKQDGYVVMSVVSHRELVQLNRLIQEKMCIRDR